MGESLYASFDSTMKKALFLLLILFILVNLAGNALSAQSLEPEILFTIPITGFVIHASIIYFIRNIRGNTKKSGSALEATDRIGVWGYIWRDTVIRVIGTILAMLPYHYIAGTQPKESLLASLVFMTLAIPCFAMTTWLVFSNNRLNQLKQIMAYF